MTSNVVVWCYSYYSPNLWNAFSPKVSNFIESTYSSIKYISTNGKQSENQVIDIGSKSQQFNLCEVDLQQKVLRRTNQGTEEPICRNVFPSDSVFGKKNVWQFDGGSCDSWVPFDIESNQLIEDAYNKGISDVDLMSAIGLPYTINVKKRCQVNIRTGRNRTIRRQTFAKAYYSDSSNSNTGPKALSGSDSSNPSGKQFSTGMQLRKKRRTTVPSMAQSQSGVASSQKSSSSAVHSTSRKPCGASLLPKQKHIEIPKLKSSTIADNNSCIERYTTQVSLDDDTEGLDEECVICFNVLKEASGYYDEDAPITENVVKLLKCKHLFHKVCLLEMYKAGNKDGFLECPSCKCLHGDKIGICPAGTMEWTLRRDITLPGNEDHRTIQVTYNIPPGIQVQGHPHPERPYAARGFPRIGYLPDSKKGIKILKLLMEAFQRRLMFTVGTSVTTGESDTVVWNEIHHKTEATGNYSGHGYPDPNYLDNVLMELSVLGVTDDCLEG